MHHTLKVGHRRQITGLVTMIGAMCLGAPALGGIIYQQDFENWNNANGLWSTGTQASLGGPYTNLLGRFSAQTARLDLLATPENTALIGGGGGNTNPFNITVNRLADTRNRVPFPDSSGGGVPSAPIGGSNTNVPTLDLGQAIINASSGNSGPPVFGAGIYAVHFDLMLFDSWDGGWAPYGPDRFGVAVNGQSLFDELLYGEAYGPDLNFRNPDETPASNVYNSQWIDSIYRDITLTFKLTTATDLLSIEFIGAPSQSIFDESWGIDNILVEQLIAGRSTSVPSVPVPGTLVLLGGGIGLAVRRKR